MKSNEMIMLEKSPHIDYETRKSLIRNYPIYFIIEPTNYCNYKCSICPNQYYANEEKGYMSIDLFDKILEQIKNVAEVIQLYWLGEPLLHPGIFDMIRMCKEKTNAKIMISTNGSLLSDDVVKKLVNSGLDKLIVSMDAASSNSIYQSMRCGGDLETINFNVSNLIKYSSNIDITLQFILTFANKCEKDSFVSKWANKGVKVSIQCLYTWANQMPELNSMSDFLSPMRNVKRVPCADLWYKMAIHWNGMVSRCCFDWSFKSIVGNVSEQEVFSVWNSSEMQKLRIQQTNERYQGICCNCDAWASEEEYETLFD